MQTSLSLAHEARLIYTPAAEHRHAGWTNRFAV